MWACLLLSLHNVINAWLEVISNKIKVSQCYKSTFTDLSAKITSLQHLYSCLPVVRVTNNPQFPNSRSP